MGHQDSAAKFKGLGLRWGSRLRKFGSRVVSWILLIGILLLFAPGALRNLGRWVAVRVRNRASAAYESGWFVFAALTGAAAGVSLLAAAVTTDPWWRNLMLDAGSALLLFLALQLVLLRGRGRPHRVLAASLGAAGVGLLVVTWRASPTGAGTTFRMELLTRVGVGLLLFVALEVWLAGLLDRVQERTRAEFIRIVTDNPEGSPMELELWARLDRAAEQQQAQERQRGWLPGMDDVTRATGP